MPKKPPITTANREPYTVRWQRQIITRHHEKVNVGVIPWINKGRAISVWFTNPFLLLEMVQFREGSLFAHGLGRRIIGGNFLPLTMGRIFIFCQRLDELFERGGFMVRF